MAEIDIETKRLKEAVGRNMERFEGDDFMFQLSEKEMPEFSRSQFATLNSGRGSNIKYTHFAFTELGVAMLSSVLNSKTAIELCRIMRAFVALRQMLANRPLHKEVTELRQEVRLLAVYLEEVIADQNDINEDTRIRLELINRSLAELQNQKRINEKPRRPVGYTVIWEEHNRQEQSKYQGHKKKKYETH